jgi:hypothetical protein
MSQNLEIGLIIKGLTGDTNTLNTKNSLGSDTFVVNDTRNVGIGTNNPSERLEVSGKTKTESLQITSGATNIGYVLTLTDINGNSEWQAPVGIFSISGVTPISSSTVGNNSVISIPHSKADGSTKGAAAFNSSDFNDNGNGLISIDYVNGQSASASTKGFVTSTNWTSFNNKQNTVTLTTTGSTGVATFNPTTGALNVPTYGGSTGSGLGYTLLFGFSSTQNVISTAFPETYVFGPNVDGEWLLVANDRFSRRNRAIKSGTIKSASVMIELASTYPGPTTGATMNLYLQNITSGTSHTIDATFPVNSATTSNGWSGVPPSRNTFYAFSPEVQVTQGDQLQIRFTPRSFAQGWTSSVVISEMIVYLFIE